MKHTSTPPFAGAPFVLPLTPDIGPQNLVAVDDAAERVAWARSQMITLLDLQTGVERQVPCEHAKGEWFDYDWPDPRGQLVLRDHSVWLHDRRDGKLWLWDLNSDQPPAVVFEYAPGLAVFSDDGSVLLHLDGKKVRRVDVATGASTELRFGTRRTIVALGLSARGDHAVAATSGAVHLVSPGVAARAFAAPEGRALNSVAVSASGAHVLASGRVKGSSSGPESYVWSAEDPSPHVVQGRCAAFAGDEESTLFCGWRGQYSLVRLGDSEEDLFNEHSSIRALSRDGSTLASVDGWYRLDLIDFASGERRRVLAPTDHLSDATGTPAGLYLACNGYQASSVLALDPKGANPRSHSIPNGGTLRLSVSPDGSLLAVSGSTGVVALGADDLTPRWRGLVNRALGPTCFLPAGQLAAAEGETVHFVDSETGKANGSLDIGHEVSALALREVRDDGETPWLIAAGDGGATRIDFTTRLALPLDLKDLTIDALSPCGRYLLARRGEGHVIVSAFDGEELAALAPAGDSADWMFRRGTFAGEYFLGLDPSQREVRVWSIDGGLVSRNPWPFPISWMRTNAWGTVAWGPDRHQVAWWPLAKAPALPKTGLLEGREKHPSTEEPAPSAGPTKETPGESPTSVKPPAKQNVLAQVTTDTPKCLNETGEIVVFGHSHLVALEVATGQLVAETRLETGWAESLRFHEARVIIQAAIPRDSKEPSPIYSWDLGADPVRIGGVEGRLLALSDDGLTAIVDGMRPRDSQGYLKHPKGPAVCVALDVTDGTRTELVAKHRNDVIEVSMSAGDLLASVDGAKLRVFGHTSSRPKNFDGPKGTLPERVALSWDGRYVAGTFVWQQKLHDAGRDLIVWDVATRKQVLALSQVAHHGRRIEFVGSSHSLAYWSPSPTHVNPWDSKCFMVEHIGDDDHTALPSLARGKHLAFSGDRRRCALVWREITVIDLESGDILLGGID